MVITRRYYTLADCNIDLAKLVDPTKMDLTTSKLISLLNLKYEDSIILYGDDDEDISPKIDHWKDLFKFIYETTSARYKKIIELYQANENNLLNKITSTTTNRFNDTPQQLGVFEDTQYNTNVATSTSETDNMELIDRIHNIRGKLVDEYALWVNEFSKLFDYAR